MIINFCLNLLKRIFLIPYIEVNILLWNAKTKSVLLTKIDNNYALPEKKLYITAMKSDDEIAYKLLHEITDDMLNMFKITSRANTKRIDNIFSMEILYGIKIQKDVKIKSSKYVWIQLDSIGNFYPIKDHGDLITEALFKLS